MEREQLELQVWLSSLMHSDVAQLVDTSVRDKRGRTAVTAEDGRTEPNALRAAGRSSSVVARNMVPAV